MHQDVHAGSKQKIVVEYDESKRERQDIIACSDFEELAYAQLEAKSAKLYQQFRPHSDIEPCEKAARKGGGGGDVCPWPRARNAHSAHQLQRASVCMSCSDKDRRGKQKASPVWDSQPVSEKDGTPSLGTSYALRAPQGEGRNERRGT